MRVLAFVGTRADLFPLSPVLVRLSEDPNVELHIASAIGFAPTTAAARLSDSGLAAENFTHHDLGLFLETPSVEAQLQLGPRLASDFGALLARVKPDAFLILGDRWELLYVVPAAVISGVRVVHLHGGEVTEGAIDERVRHAVTKLADQHCVATAGSAARVAQLGEDPRRIHQSGAPGLDRLATARPYSDAEFSAEFGVELQRPLIMVTLHPSTAEVTQDEAALARMVFDAVRAEAGTAVFTYPGFDNGRDEIIAELDRIAALQDPRAIVIESLGARYPRVLASVDAVVGNSSSGIIEAATFGVPVLDIGARQQGREHGANVLHAEEDQQAIRAILGQVLSDPFRATARAVVNPYGDSQASARIADVVIRSAEETMIKSFKDLEPGGNAT